jgi:hypothetical protein
MRIRKPSPLAEKAFFIQQPVTSTRLRQSLRRAKPVPHPNKPLPNFQNEQEQSNGKLRVQSKIMKLSLLLLFAGCSIAAAAQRVGIGTTTPQARLAIDSGIVIDQNNRNNGLFTGANLLQFGSMGGAGIGSNKLNGAAFNGLDFYTKGAIRMRIDTSGNVAIGSTLSPDHQLYVNDDALIGGQTIAWGGIGAGTSIPDLSTYKMDINGHARIRQDQYINRDLWVDRNLDVDGTSNFLGNIVASNNLTVSGNITVDAGKGILRSTNGTQQVITYPSGALQFTNAPAGHTQDVQFAFSNVFSAAPHISVAELTDMTGTFERWTLTIHSIDLANRRFWVRFYNASSSSSTMSMNVHFIAVGPAL